MNKGNLKVFSKNGREPEAMIQYVESGYRIEFRIEKCDVLMMRSEKSKPAEEIELPNQECMRTLGEKENYWFSEILEADTIKQAEMKEKIKKKVQEKDEKVSRKPNSAADISSKR